MHKSLDKYYCAGECLAAATVDIRPGIGAGLPGDPRHIFMRGSLWSGGLGQQCRLPLQRSRGLSYNLHKTYSHTQAPAMGNVFGKSRG